MANKITRSLFYSYNFNRRKQTYDFFKVLYVKFLEKVNR